MQRQALFLSKYIVEKCILDKCPISNLQLQKILYYIQKDFLQRDDIAFYDDIEAWQFGPVVLNVYYYYCGYGAMPITTPPLDSSSIEEPNEKYIIPIITEKRALNPWELVQDTHKKNGAWDITYKDGEGNRHIIPRELIKKEQ